MTSHKKQRIPPNSAPPTPEQNLWKNVVTQAVRDAFSKDEEHKRRAWAWFFRRSRDYGLVCEMAGISADSLRQTLIETVFFNHLVQKGGFIMKNLVNKQIKTEQFEHEAFGVELQEIGRGLQKIHKSLTKQFEIARRAKAIFRAIYSQQELDKAIGSLTLQDIINICKQSEYELDADTIIEAPALEADHD
jgi:hypothetical protein